MSTIHTPGMLRDWLGNGAWLVAVHTKKCKRNRRGVTPSERSRSLVPNRNEAFIVAMRERDALRTRAAIAAATGEQT